MKIASTLRFMVGLVLLFTTVAIAQEKAIQLKSFDTGSLELEFKAQSFNFVEVETEQGLMFLPQMQGASPLLIKGAPDLQKYACSYIIPKAQNTELRVVNSVFKDYRVEVAPSKGDLLRNIDPSTVKRSFGDAYQVDAFFPSKIIDAQEPHIVRDFNAQALWVYPFQYNPVTKTLRVYESMTIEVQYEGKISNPSVVDAEFKSIYESLFLNYDQVASSVNQVSNPNMLIISHADYMSAMEPFMDWKTQKGISNEIIDIASIGGEEELKTYISNYFSENGLTYVLFVGDHQHIPAYNHSSGYSDNYYGYIEGDDSYPEVFVGRFSAESIADVTVQVDRVLQYEKTPAQSNKYGIGIGVGSAEGPGDDGEYDYEHLRNIRDTLMGYTYHTVFELYDGSQGGIDSEGNPTSSDVHALVDEGLGIINYTGHGSDNSCASSGYNSTFVNTLTNMEVHPFFWSVACVNGNFTGTTCFAESWLRASYEGKPTGAIGTMMSTINQSWAPPMCGQDAMNEALVATSISGVHRSFGSLSMNGCMVMNDIYGSGGATMTDTWTCFGDPSVIVRSDNPVNIEVASNEVIPVGSTSYEVTCSTEGAEVVLSSNEGIISTALVQGGIANLSFEALNQVENLTLTVNAFNAIPIQDEVSVMVLEGPWLVVSDYIINDTDGVASYGESFPLHFTIQNIGNQASDESYVNVTSGSSLINIASFESAVPPLYPGESYTYSSDELLLTVAQSISDGELAVVDFDLLSGSNEWESNLSLTLNAPLLEIESIEGDLEFGQSNTVIMNLINSGSAPLVLGSITANIENEWASVITSNTEIINLQPGETFQIDLDIYVAENAPANTTTTTNILVADDALIQPLSFNMLTPMCLNTDIAVDVTIVTDTWGSETSWELITTEGLILAESALGAYDASTLYITNVCSQEGSLLTFNLYDSYGDGITSTEGFNIEVCGNEVVSNSNFESEFNTSFLVSCNIEIVGCSNETASNFNPEATYDDGSCVYPLECDSQNSLSLYMHDSYGDGWNGNTIEIYTVDESLILTTTLEDGLEGLYEFCVSDGCYIINTTDIGSYDDEVSWDLLQGTDTIASGLSPSSISITLNSECYFVDGCTNILACNYNELANVDNGTCTYAPSYFDCDGTCISDVDSDGYCDELEIYGCTDQDAVNYDADATEEDNTCVYSSDCGANFLMLNMYDSFGDGWNGNLLTIISEIGDTLHSVSLAEGTSASETYCLTDGCYQFNTNDIGGWPYEVSWDLLDTNSNILLSGAAPSSFILTLGDITCNYSGCTNETALNYNPIATEDDGSCVYDDCICVDLWDPVCGSNGITYGNSCEADCDGIDYVLGECSSIVYGCPDADASNYNPNATVDDGSCNYGTQNPWEIILTGSNHTIVVDQDVQLLIDESPVSDGDWIGVFYVGVTGNLQCAGSIMWDGQTNAIAAQGDDATTNELDGLAEGEEFIWLIWDASEDLVYPANATYLNTMPNTNFYTTNGISALLTLESAPAVTEQVIDLNLGWNLFSSYMLTSNMDLAAMVAPIFNDVIIVKDNTGLAYLPDWQFNGIGNMQVGQGYQIKMIEANSFIVEGDYMVPEENPITLYEGWNMFGALRLEASNVSAVFEEIEEHVVIVKDEEGLAYLPDWNFNGIGEIIPGKAYQAKLLTTQILQYLSNDASYRTSSIEVTANEVSHYAKVVATDNNMTVIIEDASWDVIPAEGSEVAAYDAKGNLIGSALYTSPLTVLTVWGDDAMTSTKDGLSTSEVASFELWTKETTASFEVTEWVEGSSAYSVDGINVAGTITTNVVAETLTADRVLVKVINVLGQEVENVEAELFEGKVLFNVYNDGSVEKVVK